MGYPTSLDNLVVGGCNFVLRNGAWVAWDGGTNLDLDADIEIDGTPVNQEGFQATASGTTTLITPATTGRLKIYRGVIYPGADVTGEIKINLGTTTLSRPLNPKTGGAYGFNCSDNFKIGATGSTLSIVTPTAVTVNIDVTWEEI